LSESQTFRCLVRKQNRTNKHLMKIQQKVWRNDDGWTTQRFEEFEDKECLVLAFGDRLLLEQPKFYSDIKSFYPKGAVILNSTSGEIIDGAVIDHSIVVTAIQFEKTKFIVKRVNIKGFVDSSAAGQDLARQLPEEGLKHVLIISDGGTVNGSDLVTGLNKYLPPKVTTTGGLAGDGSRFEATLVGWNEQPGKGNIIAIGLYGKELSVGYGSVGGWDTFGPKRIVTKSNTNVLYELDGKSCLQLYKRYLGEKAEGLPSSALHFPLSIQLENSDQQLVRTILSIDEDKQCMIFAGDVPEGAVVQLMRANYDKLIDGAFEAADSCKNIEGLQTPEIALLISCVGRKLVLDQRIDEEIESVQEAIGQEVPITGFYSYGEISPFAGFTNCELHNQTMTITLLSEN